MIRNTVVNALNYFYPLGNTPAVCLTQDLPPEEDADILLLGCGDARNVLFTCWADKARRIDVTCVDIEPGIHARNVLLYTLLAEDSQGVNVERIWNIYFHWKIDSPSCDLLHEHVETLLCVSESVEQWHNSKYGSWIRFCNARTLELVRVYWLAFRSDKDLAPVEQSRREKGLQASLDRAKDLRKRMMGDGGIALTGTRSASPAGLFGSCTLDFAEISKEWWNHGITVPGKSSVSAQAATVLNPAMLHNEYRGSAIHYGTEPLLGFPLSTAYAPISKDSEIYVKREGSSSAQHLVDSAKAHFAAWTAAFRKAVKNGTVIRLFTGDALAFCLTLANCRRTDQSKRSTSAYIFCDNWSCKPIVLDQDDYGGEQAEAPLAFDIVDTSNLADHLGPLNMMAVTSNLVKAEPSSSLYTEILVQHDTSVADRLNSFLGVDVRSISLLLGIAPAEIFTNATYNAEDDIMLTAFKEIQGTKELRGSQTRSRLRWKRVQDALPILMEQKQVAGFLVKVYDHMFRHEDPSSLMSSMNLGDRSRSVAEMQKRSNPYYNRASFALLVSLLRSTIKTDWDACVKDLYDQIFSNVPFGSVRTNFAQETMLFMHLFGVNDGTFVKPTAYDQSKSILASALPSSGDLPDQLCVTVRVPRANVKALTESPEKSGSPAICCTFEGADPGMGPWANSFSTVQVAFGQISQPSGKGNFSVQLEEDAQRWWGDRDVFISVFVPTWMLIHSKRKVPIVKCSIVANPAAAMHFMDKLGMDLCFYQTTMSSENVFITPGMPGMSNIPEFPLIHLSLKDQTKDSLALRLEPDFSKIASLTRHHCLDDAESKAKLVNKASAVTVNFRSPLTADVHIGFSLQLKVDFPVPVNQSKHKVRVARKSSYIEIEAPLLNPLQGDEESDSFLFPSLLPKTSQGVAEAPISWTATRLDLNVMPCVDKLDAKSLPWLTVHTTMMFSTRERRIRDGEATNGTRVDLKDSLFSIFMQYSGHQGQKANIFGLSKEDGGVQALIIPSCLRLDLLNHTIVMDAAVVPLLSSMMLELPSQQFLSAMTGVGIMGIKVSEAEFRCWQGMFPAMAERCRTWSHKANSQANAKSKGKARGRKCEYIRVNEVPLTAGMENDGISPICTCGVGKFPSGYINTLPKLTNLAHVLEHYATRMAIGPVFAVPYVEDCFGQGMTEADLNRGARGPSGQALGGSSGTSSFKSYPEDKCAACGSRARKGGGSGGGGGGSGEKNESNSKSEDSKLLVCSRCKKARYCSVECQRADWKGHKGDCSAS